MRYIKQFLIILAVSLSGEVLHSVLPLPVPASIYGLVLMLAGLGTGLIPLEKVKEAGGFLIEIMPMMFIPAGVGLMVSWPQLKEVFVPVCVTVAATTILVMGVTGRVTQFIVERQGEKHE